MILFWTTGSIVQYTQSNVARKVFSITVLFYCELFSCGHSFGYSNKVSFNQKLFLYHDAILLIFIFSIVRAIKYSQYPQNVWIHWKLLKLWNRIPYLSGSDFGNLPPKFFIISKMWKSLRKSKLWNLIWSFKELKYVIQNFFPFPNVEIHWKHLQALKSDPIFLKLYYPEKNSIAFPHVSKRELLQQGKFFNLSVRFRHVACSPTPGNETRARWGEGGRKSALDKRDLPAPGILIFTSLILPDQRQFYMSVFLL